MFPHLSSNVIDLITKVISLATASITFIALFKKIKIQVPRVQFLKKL